jgi:hypothetical protein
LYAKLRKCEY